MEVAGVEHEDTKGQEQAEEDDQDPVEDLVLKGQGQSGGRGRSLSGAEVVVEFVDGGGVHSSDEGGGGESGEMGHFLSVLSISRESCYSSECWSESGFLFLILI